MGKSEMTETPDIASRTNRGYERFRPDNLEPGMSIFWWVKKRPYILFIVRELTSVFVAAYAIVLMFQLRALGQGEAAWESLMAAFSTPASIVLHGVLLVFVIFHSITWFRLAPTAVVLRIRKRRVPAAAVIGVNLVVWIVLSLLVAWLILSA